MAFKDRVERFKEVGLTPSSVLIGAGLGLNQTHNILKQKELRELAKKVAENTEFNTMVFEEAPSPEFIEKVKNVYFSHLGDDFKVNSQVVKNFNLSGPDTHAVIFESAPTQEFAVKMMLESKNKIPKTTRLLEFLKASRYPVAFNLGGTVLAAQAYKHGPAIFDKIKEYISKSDLTREAAVLVKEELEKRAVDSSISKIVAEIDISTVVNKFRG